MFRQHRHRRVSLTSSTPSPPNPVGVSLYSPGTTIVALEETTPPLDAGLLSKNQQMIILLITFRNPWELRALARPTQNHYQLSILGNTN